MHYKWQFNAINEQRNSCIRIDVMEYDSINRYLDFTVHYLFKDVKAWVRTFGCQSSLALAANWETKQRLIM
jgi:hypothetical protein